MMATRTATMPRRRAAVRVRNMGLTLLYSGTPKAVAIPTAPLIRHGHLRRTAQGNRPKEESLGQPLVADRYRNVVLDHHLAGGHQVRVGIDVAGIVRGIVGSRSA